MTPTPDARDRRHRAFELYCEARKLDAQQREEFLSQKCDDDAALLSEVHRRLASEQHHQTVQRGARRLDDDYELIREIGRGGVGVVYEATQKSIKRRVAVKVLLAGHYASNDELERFIREAETAGELDHPGIVPIYEIGHETGRNWIAMKFIEGLSLQDLISTGPVEHRRAAALVRSAAVAIAAAHARGVIHRDLKPANILMDGDQQPVITDFGLAKRLSTDVTLTETGQILGSPSYMAPEQARGDRQHVGVSADIYALGAVL